MIKEKLTFIKLNDLESALETGKLFTFDEREDWVAETWDENLSIILERRKNNIQERLDQYGYSVKLLKISGNDGLWPIRDIEYTARDTQISSQHPEHPDQDVIEMLADCLFFADDAMAAYRAGDIAKCASMTHALGEQYQRAILFKGLNLYHRCLNKKHRAIMKAYSKHAKEAPAVEEKNQRIYRGYLELKAKHPGWDSRRQFAKKMLEDEKPGKKPSNSAIVTRCDIIAKMEGETPSKDSQQPQS